VPNDDPAEQGGLRLSCEARADDASDRKKKPFTIASLYQTLKVEDKGNKADLETDLAVASPPLPCSEEAAERNGGTVVATPYASKVCHCVGSTFQVFITAMELWHARYGGDGTYRGLSVSQMKSLRSVWYVASGGTQGAKAALTGQGLGTAVAHSAAQPGDFVQIWRNSGSGHSVVFAGWKKTGGKITGITYWSCNSGGPGTLTETVGAGAKDVDPARIHIGRALAPGTLKPDSGPAQDARPPADRGQPRKDTQETRPDQTWPRDQRHDVAPGADLPSAMERDGGGQSGTVALAGGCRVGTSRAGPVWPWILLSLAGLRRRRHLGGPA
jgi:uncharacterized protein (TIGR03382 family)